MAPVLPVRGGGPGASTVVGASAIADILQEQGTTVDGTRELEMGINMILSGLIPTFFVIVKEKKKSRRG